MDLLCKYKAYPKIIFGGNQSEAKASKYILSEKIGGEFIPTPFKMAQLYKRLLHLLHKQHLKTLETFTIGDYQFVPSERKLIDKAKNQVKLTEKESQILLYLYRHAGTEVSQSALIKNIWGYSSKLINSHTLQTHIYRLRRKIEHKKAKSSLLLTESNGYRLVCE